MDTVVYVNKISKFSIQSTKIMFGIFLQGYHGNSTR